METLLDIVNSRQSIALTPRSEKDQILSLHSFSGTVWEALDDTISGFERIIKYWATDVDIKTIISTVLNNWRIFRGISSMKSIELSVWRSSFSYSSLMNDYVRNSLLLNIGSESVLDSLSNFSSKLWSMLDLEISQKPDLESWLAMNPKHTIKTAQELKSRLCRDEYIFIALWNWWIVPWFDVYSKLNRSSCRTSVLYPVRYSRIKSKDRWPQFTPEELEYLKSIIRWKKIIIFDEDASSGNTLNNAKKYLAEQFPDNKWIILRSNIWRYAD